MFLVGERVDDVELARRRGELLQDFLRKRPDDDAVDPSFEIARDVGDRLAPPQCYVGLQRHHVAAQFAHGDLERRARAQRRLVEQQRQMPAVERIRGRRQAAERAVGLHVRRDLQAALEIRRIEIEDRQKILASLRGGLGHVR
jgi:hypothetical protein